MSNSQQQVPARTKFITPGELIEGTITNVDVNQEPFHCIIKIEPKDPKIICAEGRYSSNQMSLGKLQKNLSHLKFTIKDVEDIIGAVESLEGRECLFKVDKSGWVSWISRLTSLKPTPIPAPVLARQKEETEIFFERERGRESIYRMMNQDGGVAGWAVGPTDVKTRKAHGWTLYLETMEDAIRILQSRKIKA